MVDDQAKRDCCLWSLRRAAEEEGTAIVSIDEWDELRDDGVTTTNLAAEFADGRTFGIGYEHG